MGATAIEVALVVCVSDEFDDAGGGGIDSRRAGKRLVGPSSCDKFVLQEDLNGGGDVEVEEMVSFYVEKNRGTTGSGRRRGHLICDVRNESSVAKGWHQQHHHQTPPRTKSTSHTRSGKHPYFLFSGYERVSF